MPDENIERTIYRLELDGSSYINGVDKLSASTQKLSLAQEQANKTLQDNQKALQSQSEYLAQTKKDLDAYTGTNERYRQQLSKSFQSAQSDNQRLTDIVNKSKAAYDSATASAQNFANVAAQASNVQQTTTGGKIVPAQISSQIGSILNVPSFVDQSQAIASTKAEFEDLRTSITLADARMQQLNSTDEEFKALAPIVEQGKQALLKYDEAARISGDSSLRLRTQILLGRDALARLEAAGKENTQEYKDQRTHVAALTQEYRIAEQEITVLSSQTRAFDFGKAGVEAAVSGFQAYTAISILAGGASEELQKKTIQLFAAMQLLTALEQLATSLKKGSTIATNLQSASQAIYTAVVEASTTALGAFKLALVATGIGAAIVGLGFLIKAYLDYTDSVKEAGNVQKLFKEIQEAAIKESTAEVIHLGLVKQKLDDLNEPQAKRIELAKDYNKTAEEGNKIDLTQIDNIALLNAAIDKQIEKIRERALAKAAENVITQKSEVLFIAQENASIKAQNQRAAAEKYLADHPVVLKSEPKLRGTINQEIIDAIQAATPEGIAKDPKVIKAQKDLNDALAASKGLITIDSLFTNTKTDKVKKEIEDDFEKRKAALLEEIAKLAESEYQSEVNIRKEYKTKLDAAILEINKDKGLKPNERRQLITLATTLNTGELDKALTELRKKIKDAQDKLNEEIFTLRNKANEDTLNLIQDEFDRRAKLIEFNQQKDLAEAKINTQKSLDVLSTEKSTGLISEQQYQDAKNIIIATGEQNANNIIIKYANQRKDLAADIFQSVLQSYEDAISAVDLIHDEEEAIAVKKLNDKFLNGKISYEDYKKEIEKIKDKYDAIDKESDLRIEKDELQALDEKLATETDKYSDYYKNLKAQRDKLADDIAKKEAVPLPDPNANKKIDTVADYANAIGEVAAAVIQFWQAANDAESKALDRSIAFQERRVTEAQRIADRGNAQYLKQEEDKLTELNVARANAARRQLGIDAALQGSQILVGITGAISKIATPGIGVAETIAEIAIIIGSLATGYALVRSLSSNQPKLAKGDPYVSRGTYPGGTDTIPAMLNEGEAVIPTHRNKAYHPTIEAIYNGTVPAEHLNDFVRNYHQIKSVPQMDHSRIKEIAELHIGENGRMAVLMTEHNKKLDENNELQRLTLRAMKSMAVSAVIDKNGVAIAVNEHIQKMEIDKKI